MPAIVNSTGQVLLVRLNSGAEVNLAPRESYPVVASEIRSSPVIEKLVARGLLKIVDEDPAKGQEGEPKAVDEAKSGKARSRAQQGERS